MNNGWEGLNTAETIALQKLKILQSKVDPEHQEAFLAALTRETASRTHQFMTGVKAYRRDPWQRSSRSMPILWQSGTTKIRDYHPEQPSLPIVFVIPSLINRFDILDLEEDYSFLHWLAAQGFRPLVVDWDCPGDQEKDFGLTDYVTQRLIPALQALSVQDQRPVHVIGYCMGGLLAAALAVLKPGRVQSLSFLATPWDFHQGDARYGVDYLALAEKVMPHLDQMNEMPVDIIQSLFATLQPFKVMNKFSAFAAMDRQSAQARHFIALEDWLNNGVPLTAAVARECLVDLYGHNKTMQGQWLVAGQVINPQHLTMPAYVMVPGKDRIVPPASSLPLARLLPQATLHEPMMGHIGLMASHKATQEVWVPFALWLRQQTPVG